MACPHPAAVVPARRDTSALRARLCPTPYPAEARTGTAPRDQRPHSLWIRGTTPVSLILNESNVKLEGVSLYCSCVCLGAQWVRLYPRGTSK